MLFIKKYLLFFILVTIASPSLFGMESDCIAIFAHGLGGNASNGSAYRSIIGCPILSQDGPEWRYDLHGSHVGPQQSCLAQEADIAVVTNQLAEHQGIPFILMGVSKGAATMINTVGWLAVNNPAALATMKAIILDSPFATPEKVAAFVAGQYVERSLGQSIGGCTGSCIHSTLDCAVSRPIVSMMETRLYPNYNPSGITPIKAVSQMWQTVDKNMVIVFIHSKQDELISINNSRSLYLELKKLGFLNLYLIEAEAGEHANVCWGPSHAYISKILRLIYLKHGLPMPPSFEGTERTLVENDEHFLSSAQPSIEEIESKLYSTWYARLLHYIGLR